jgi:hypothetical protein
MPTRTKDELEKVNAEYKVWLPEWQFFIRSYFGGKHYRDGNYLLQHPFESPSNYTRRKSIAYFYNYCQPIVDIFVAHLYKPTHKREYGSLSDNVLFKNFILDADYDGTGYIEFFKTAERFASIYGRSTIVVDKPSVTTSTVAEAQDKDIRPYLTLVTPENVLDWEYVRLDTGRTVLNWVKIREFQGTEKTSYRIWSRIGWELWEIDKAGKVIEVSAGTHDLGEVPVVNLLNKRGSISMRMIGQSDIQDIADVNKNIYYLCSDAKEIIENTAFPMMSMPYENTSGAEEKEIGPRNILEFEPEAQHRPEWLEPPHNSLTEIREWIMQDMKEIFRIANLGGMINVETSKQPWSGPGQEIQGNRLTAAMAQKADFAEEGELAVLRLWAKWQGIKFDGSVKYQRDFSIRDITIALQNSMSAQSAAIHSTTFVKENEKKIVDSALPKMSDETRKVIYDEIDAATITTTPVDNGDNNSNDE